MSEPMRGQITRLAFEDGVQRDPDCGLDECECPEHENAPAPAGTYVTVRLDQDLPMGLWRVEITREES